MAYDFDRKDPPEFYEEVVKLSMSGLSLEEIGNYFGQDPDDWLEWCEQRPLVALKHQQGKARGLAIAGAQLMRQIDAGKINAITFYLKTQGDFTEKSLTQIEDITKPPMPRPPIPTDPTQAASTYRQFMKDS